MQAMASDQEDHKTMFVMLNKTMPVYYQEDL